MPGKLDFNVEETHADQQTVSQTTGVSEQLAARFLTSVKAQVEKLPGILRLGFGHSFFAPCEDQAAAYKAMGSCLPSVVVDPSSCDFYYRINRRRTLEFEGRPIVINRLSHWACLRKFSSVLDGNIITQKELGEAVSLTTDINTDHATILTDCSSASKSAIVGQLHSFSIEISVRGDIR
jgi:hypothetical protein